MAVIEGIDYAWNGPAAAAVAAAGKKFVVRYGGPGSIGKQLTAPELIALRAAGLDVVANAEGPSGGFRGTTAGRNWAASASAHFSGLGMPAGRPIYFSVDWAAGAADWADIDAALRGAASVIGPAQVGVYGGYDTIAHCAATGSARWFWQTYAWSSGRWHSACHLEQYRNGVTIGGSDCDLTRAMVADYGQWGYEEEDVATKDDMLAALKEFFAPYVSTNPDGKTVSKIGVDAFNQPVPNPFQGGARTTAWKLMFDIATQTMTQSPATDPAAVAAAVLAGLTPNLLATAIVQAGLTPQAIAAAIPADLATDVVTLLGQRIAGLPGS